ncbi:MAG: AI-2E family transporter [Oscillospiraceae bacterium]|nr:AI-2E family transporter [Oscillospiraceae bacterium]
MNLTKENVKKICGIILFTVVVFLAIQNLDKVFSGISFVWGIIFPFILGGIIAFILNIPMRAIEKHLFGKCVKTVKNADGSTKTEKKKFVRPVSILITVIAVLAVIAAVMLIVVPQIGDTTKELVKTAETFFPKVQVYAEDLFRNNAGISEWISELDFNIDKILSESIDFLKNGMGNVVSGTLTAAKAVVSGITSFVIGMIFAFYLLAKKETILRQVNMIMNAALPKKAVDKIIYVAKLSNETFSSFIVGQCIEAVILGLMFFIVMSIIRLPYPLLISVLIAFTALIPVFGAFIGCIVGAFLIIMVSPVKALIFVVMFLVIQQIEGNLIYPRVVGKSVGLPSLWVLAAVTIGSSLMGVAGMLFFIPLTSVIYTLIREWTYKRLETKKISADSQDDKKE